MPSRPGGRQARLLEDGAKAGGLAATMAMVRHQKAPLGQRRDKPARTAVAAMELLPTEAMDTGPRAVEEPRAQTAKAARGRDCLPVTPG
ncbi:hypothetical protein [Kitasatospora kazusensis]|uniref:hypothetical protein n=1 Tax=Kitasatospora kazusensis TaxID=407974 RepID=UPI0031D16236